MNTLPLFTDIETPETDASQPITVDRAVYRERCDARWGGMALRNARGNWHTWAEIHDNLESAMRTFARNPQMEDLTGKAHNPAGTLTDFLWKLQSAIEPNQSCLYPLLDFEEHFQRVFLRRGLIVYCTLILEALEK